MTVTFDKHIFIDTYLTYLPYSRPLQRSGVLIELKLQKDLLWFTCRHHVSEVVIGGVYTAIMGPSSGLEVTLFIHFQREWHSMDHDKYSSVLHSLEGMKAIESDKIQEIIQLAQRHIDVSSSC